MVGLVGHWSGQRVERVRGSDQSGILRKAPKQARGCTCTLMNFLNMLANLYAHEATILLLQQMMLNVSHHVRKPGFFMDVFLRLDDGDLAGKLSLFDIVP